MRFFQVMQESCMDEIEKIAAKGKTAANLPVLGALAAGGALALLARRANEDRKLGKQVRRQQGVGY
jgi:hypothetical protein